MFEFVFYLRHMKILRYVSWLAALIYNTFYYAFLITWLFEIYSMTPEDYNNIQPLDILWNMFFIYNTILHAGNAIVGNAILLKEFELEFFTLVTLVG